MARTIRERRSVGTAHHANLGKDAEVDAALAQAHYMLGVYSEILTMDLTIVERIRQLVAILSDDRDKEGTLANLRLILVQLEKIADRIAFWNARVSSVVKGQLAR